MKGLRRTGSLRTTVPVYVTRPEADGRTGAVEISIWVPLLAMVLAFANIIGWGIYGLVELVGKVVG